jgi:UV DNA damage endonuclease
MGFAPSFENKINIHIGSTYGDKNSTIERWLKNYDRLSDSVKQRLVIENDDKASMYSVRDLYERVHSQIDIPITFDYLHNECNKPENMTEAQSLLVCLNTWPEGTPAITHYSDSRKLNEDSTAREVAHSDWIWKSPETYGLNFDIEFEVKMKERALLKYLNQL